MQGWRVDMEDAHSEQIGITPDVLKEWSYFAVFDGHAGMKVAQYCAQHLLAAILETSEMQAVVKDLKANNGEVTEKMSDLIRKGMRAGFLKLDERMRDQPEVYGENERSGTTAVCTLISPKHIFIANLGDSRAIMSRDGAFNFSSEDHKPFLPKERDRIVNAGGSVMIQRVNGSLAVSRALGDYEYKSVPGLAPVEQLVSPEPDVYCMERSPQRDEFLLLACDGVFDVMTNAELADFIRSRLMVTKDLSAIGNQILDSCLSKGSRDNMSVVLVTFAGAPKVSSEAQKAEKDLYAQLESRIQGIVSLCDNVSEVEAEYVLRILISQEIPGIPPGAGLHAVRSQVEEILKKIKQRDAAHKPSTPSSAQNPSSPSSTGSPPGSANVAKPSPPVPSDPSKTPASGSTAKGAKNAAGPTPKGSRPSTGGIAVTAVSSSDRGMSPAKT